VLGTFACPSGKAGMSFRHLTSTSVLVAVALAAAGLAVSVTTSSAATLDEGLVVHYDLTQSSGATATDIGDIRLPGNVIDGLTDVTVSVEVDFDRGWRTLTYTLGNGTETLYEDGVVVARTTGVVTGSADYLERPYFKGDVRDFRLYSRVLSPGEARELGKATASARPAADLEALDLGDTSAVTGDLVLPSKSSGGSAISWESSRPSVVSAAGVVTRPATRTGNSTITLTATATYGGYTATRDFTVTVLEDLTDRQKVDDALKDVVIYDEDAIRDDITLPVEGARGVTLAWRSVDPRVVTSTGEVTRPPHGSRSRTARLSVTATKGFTSRTRYFTLTVLPLPR
jgi:hypothetical protein